jgi:ABC-2 type transport system permease protein
MSAFKELFLTNLKMTYRDRNGLFWTLAVPLVLYIALAVLPIPNIAGGNLVYKNFVLPGVVTYVIMQSGIYTLAYWMVEMRSRGIIKRFLATPLKISQLVLSLVAARLSVILIQALILTLIGVLFFGADFAGNIISSLLLILLGGGIFLLVGLLISNYSASYQAAAPITTAIGMPLAFLGNLFFSTEILPNAFQVVSKLLPITYLANGLRLAYLYPFSFRDQITNFAVLAAWLVLLLLVTIRVFKFKE